MTKILVIEDDVLVRESLVDALAGAGHRVASARNGVEALAMLDQLARPALLVLDLQMPLMDGLTFLNELRKRPDHSAFEILPMSATVHQEWLERFPGVLRTMRKPFDVRDLLAEAEAFESRHQSPAGPVTPASEEAAPVLGPAAAAAAPEES